MNKTLYVTTNENKFNKAKINLNQFGIELVHKYLEMQEFQSSNGEEIVRNKAEQAYKHFQQPVLVNDDSWSIPALQGFPSTGMKLCNDFLVAKDWLRLMKGIEDRRIFLISYYAYYDGKSIEVVMSKDLRYFLNKAEGKNPKSPSLEVIAKMGSNTSMAKQISAGRKVEKNNTIFWNSLANIIKN